MSSPHRFFNMYLTTTISVSLVLLLVGMLCVLLLAANTLITRVKENVAITVVLKENTDSASLQRFDQMLEAVPYCHGYRYVSKEEALAEHIRDLGEDPTQFLGYNPLNDSYEIHPSKEYACPDSVAQIDKQLSSLPYVSNVIYPKDVLELMNSNLGDAAALLLAAVGILLLIALALIVNTIRLQIYSKRFIIKTMSLVGATAWTIRRPFVRKNVLMGCVAALLALLTLGALIYYVNVRLGIMLFALTWQNLVILGGAVLLSGIAITLLASVFATGHYIRMKTDSLYKM
ncbi:MAG: permease-like cell division protein FtsX [Paludibacteraceae bacterium]|nr:permease-like cell division protein FtsX [Paludibacteraceae bacterium]